MASAPFDPTLRSFSLIALLAIQLGGAFVEETLYRGYGLSQMKLRVVAPLAIIITAMAHALFACLQGPSVMAWHVVFGVFLGALTLWRKNVIPAFMCHVIFTLTPRLLT